MVKLGNTEAFDASASEHALPLRALGEKVTIATSVGVRYDGVGCEVLVVLPVAFVLRQDQVGVAELVEEVLVGPSRR
jgi:hypothetical protein